MLFCSSISQKIARSRRWYTASLLRKYKVLQKKLLELYFNISFRDVTPKSKEYYYRQRMSDKIFFKRCKLIDKREKLINELLDVYEFYYLELHYNQYEKLADCLLEIYHNKQYSAKQCSRITETVWSPSFIEKWGHLTSKYDKPNLGNFDKAFFCEPE